MAAIASSAAGSSASAVTKSLPLDGARRFGGDVVGDTIDAGNLVDNPGRNALWVPKIERLVANRGGGLEQIVRFNAELDGLENYGSFFEQEAALTVPMVVWPQPTLPGTKEVTLKRGGSVVVS